MNAMLQDTTYKSFAARIAFWHLKLAKPGKAMIENSIVSWSTCSKSQFLSYNTGKLQLLEFLQDNDNLDGIRTIKEVKAWESPAVQCIDWRSPVDGPILAYGTNVGSVYLINTHSDDEVCNYEVYS